MSGTKLTRSVYLEGVLLAEGTEVTAEQKAKLKNPKLFAEPVDATGPDANDTREYFQAIRKESDDSAYRKPVTGEDDETDDRAAAGARLARKTAAPKATA
jgi:hypothetical protein